MINVSHCGILTLSEIWYRACGHTLQTRLCHDFLNDLFGQPFVKRFALCYQMVVCPVCLSVCDVRALWPNGWTDHDETWHAGRPRRSSHVFDSEFCNAAKKVCKWMTLMGKIVAILRSITSAKI